MESTHYSISQLLAIRGTKLQYLLEQKLLENAKENPILTGIIRHKRPFVPQRAPLVSRANMEVRQSSSGDSEFQAPAKLQAPQVLAPLHDKPVRTLRHITADVSQLDGHSGPQLDGQDAEPEHQPELPSQRSVLPDQKRKGFEQFYEAVRSPTHVRVTAGGRIVPNTLDASHSSPTGKSIRERTNIDINGVQSPMGQAFNGQFMPGTPLMGPIHSAMQSTFPMMAPGPNPMVSFGGFAMPPFGVPQAPTQAQFAPLNSGMIAVGNSNEKKDPNSGVIPNTGAMPMPPFGGQWFLPPHPMMPMGMQYTGGPTYPGAPMMPMGFGPVGQPMGQPMMYQQPPQSMPTAGARPFTPNVPAESCPVSSIRPSIITKNQLAGLRSSLKKAEAQLAYNRHQIDEKHMEEYARQLRSDIEHFEIKLKGELALEDNTLSQRSDAKDVSEAKTSKESKPTAAESRKTLMSVSSGDADIKNVPVHNSRSNVTEEPKNPRHRKRDRLKLAVDTSAASAPYINSTVFATISPVPFDPTGQNQTRDSDSLHFRKQSTGLPVSAALAPVFQPRSDLRRPNENTPPVSAVPKAGKETGDKVFHGILRRNQEASDRLFSGGPPTPDLDEQLAELNRENPVLGMAYLVGQVPFGMDPSPDIRDYVYHRPLNQDEEMAKHLYWSNAPSHLRANFPFFDGRSFWLSSPEKAPRCVVSDERVAGRLEEEYRLAIKGDKNPFAALERLTGPNMEQAVKDLKRDTKSDNVTSPMKRRYKSRPVAHFNSQGLHKSKDSTISSDNVVKSDSEKAYFNSCVRTWSEKVTASATALPGAVTSENAQGYVPQYAIGHAAASLSPAIANAANQSTRLSPSKLDDNGKSDTSQSLLVASADVRVENQPPGLSIHLSRNAIGIYLLCYDYENAFQTLVRIILSAMAASDINALISSIRDPPALYSKEVVLDTQIMHLVLVTALSLGRWRIESMVHGDGIS
ncbi:hypothetical protein BDP55DRAFT_750573 [Colletotrichum godetiae]|uniref:Uncharacterized protein n=1 Tax=Colletotrichum godetiae TaxID=1209918 RepID=A0AAJ0EQ71_9PEZI|nr:uncharacterized protein BDP55DRAFT_750573 [Colletotrichum godetiae]KAK1672471.1 hypothetical protein BDP55DRAFT_750573 [Colletotrichum godetiae]